MTWRGCRGKELMMAYFEVLSQYLDEGTACRQRDHQSRW